MVRNGHDELGWIALFSPTQQNKRGCESRLDPHAAIPVFFKVELFLKKKKKINFSVKLIKTMM